MKSKVFFVRVSNSDDKEAIVLKFSHLLDKSNLLNFIKRGDRLAVKMHFGEEGNTGFVSPEYVGIICNKISQKQAIPFLIDTNTLYRGKRTNSKDHLKLAYEHGFTKEIVGADILIPDDTNKENTTEIAINQKFIKKAKISTPIFKAKAIVSVAHFKGHMMTGFGGALKNIGMGCASREGKLAQHCDISPYVIIERCTDCSQCVVVCPSGAINVMNKKSFIDSRKCIGCASCISACLYNAIEVDWESGADNIQEKMIEYAFAVLKDKRERLAFINFAIKITKECDCLAKDDPRISSDVGIFVSKDPVSIDKASLDLINKTCQKDIFKEAHPKRNGLKQLQYAFELGLGNLDYELIEV
ncbi:MAG: DUF362 domain-containing protein [Candidatus Omnitrophota bacterium]|nr:DUF362 domain-containing protein [Candidatus Omnitrophota bacterium]